MDSPYWKGPLPGVDVQRRYLWKTFRGKPNSIPGSARKCSASARNPVRFHPGMLFGFSPESCSTCPGMLFGLPRNTHHGTEFRFVLVQAEHLFGVATHWITKQDAIRISDLERTLIDGLRQPEYCGGITEVAKGLWMRREDLNTSRIVEYALRLGVGSVIRRLGYLLELYRLAPDRSEED